MKAIEKAALLKLLHNPVLILDGVPSPLLSHRPLSFLAILNVVAGALLIGATFGIYLNGGAQ